MVPAASHRADHGRWRLVLWGPR